MNLWYYIQEKGWQDGIFDSLYMAMVMAVMMILLRVFPQYGVEMIVWLILYLVFIYGFGTYIYYTPEKNSFVETSNLTKRCHKLFCLSVLISVIGGWIYTSHWCMLLLYLLPLGLFGLWMLVSLLVLSIFEENKVVMILVYGFDLIPILVVAFCIFTFSLPLLLNILIFVEFLFLLVLFNFLSFYDVSISPIFAYADLFG